MRHLFAISLLAMLLNSCGNLELGKETVSLKSDVPEKDSSAIKTDRIFRNPIRSITDFDRPVGCNYIDSLYKKLVQDNRTKQEVRTEICNGDNCESIKTLTGPGTTLHLFKGDAGEYGFSNDQFVLAGDTLLFVRNFSVGIETWPTDTSETIWVCTEALIYFYAKSVKVLERKTLTKDLYNFDFSLSQLPFEIKTLYRTDLYKDKKDELHSLLTMESSD